MMSDSDKNGIKNIPHQHEYSALIKISSITVRK